MLCRPINLDMLQQWVDDGRLPTDRTITMKDLRDSNCVGRKMGWGVKLLARGAQHIKAPMHLEVGAAAVSCRGGSLRGQLVRWRWKVGGPGLALALVAALGCVISLR
jgi:hypothetical protein